jgi:hypothetical protein
MTADVTEGVVLAPESKTHPASIAFEFKEEMLATYVEESARSI